MKFAAKFASFLALVALVSLAVETFAQATVEENDFGCRLESDRINVTILNSTTTGVINSTTVEVILGLCSEATVDGFKCVPSSSTREVSIVVNNLACEAVPIDTTDTV